MLGLTCNNTTHSCIYTVKSHYFVLQGEMQNSVKKKKSKLAGDSLRVLSLKEQSGMEFEILRQSELVESN